MSDVPQILDPTVVPTLSTFQTAAALQRHQEWVSRPQADIPALVEAAGFSLVGPVIRAHHNATQAYVARRDTDLVVAFRGSGGDNGGQTVLNALVDLNVRRVKPSVIVDNKKHWDVQVHKGFYDGYLEIRDAIWKAVRSHPSDHIYCTGFSLGSALATLCAFDLRLNHSLAVTFHGAGTPRVGNAHFKSRFNRTIQQALRLACTADPIPRVPLYGGDARGFLHVGRLLELNADGSPVPVNLIDGRLRASGQHISAHNRDRYATAIQGFVEQYTANAGILEAAEGKNPLASAGTAEQKSVG